MGIGEKRLVKSKRSQRFFPKLFSKFKFITSQGNQLFILFKYVSNQQTETVW